MWQHVRTKVVQRQTVRPFWGGLYFFCNAFCKTPTPWCKNDCFSMTKWCGSLCKFCNAQYKSTLRSLESVVCVERQQSNSSPAVQPDFSDGYKTQRLHSVVQQLPLLRRCNGSFLQCQQKSNANCCDGCKNAKKPPRGGKTNNKNTIEFSICSTKQQNKTTFFGEKL